MTRMRGSWNRSNGAETIASRIFPKIPQRFGAVVVVKFDGVAFELDTDGQRRQIGGVD